VTGADEVLDALLTSTPPARGVLAVTRGLPGCGKTRWAITWQARLSARGLSVARISRDDIRADLGLDPATTTPDQEAQVTTEHHDRIHGAFTNGAHVVLVDDTHLADHHLAATLDVGQEVGATVTVADLRHVPIQVCITRDATRTGTAHVGADRIHAIATAAGIGGPSPDTDLRLAEAHPANRPDQDASWSGLSG
jgi:predicted kinase